MRKESRLRSAPHRISLKPGPATCRAQPASLASVGRGCQLSVDLQFAAAVTLLLAQLLQGRRSCAPPCSCLCSCSCLSLCQWPFPFPFPWPFPFPFPVDGSREERLEVDDWLVPANRHVLKPRGQIAEQVVRMHGAASQAAFGFAACPAALSHMALASSSCPLFS